MGVAVSVLVLTTLGLSRLKPAAPNVERATLWIDTVKRGEMVREVSGNGTLVPEQIRWVSAVTAGRVERIHVQPGDRVEAAKVLVELSNPDVQLQALDAERQLTLAQAELVSLRSTLQSQLHSEQALVATARREHLDAQRALSAAERLHQEGLNSPHELQRAREMAEEQSIRYEAEQKRMQTAEETMKAQVELRSEQVSRLRAICDFQGRLIASMKVAAGDAGVLQELPLQVGQWVTPGQVLAKVVRPERLKAVLRVPETQAKDIAVGQTATIDTRNGKVTGRVARIDPAVQGGTVTVDVLLEGKLPQGARPDLSIDGLIELDRIRNTLYVGRPAFGQSNTTVGLFRLDPGGRSARRVDVKLGRTSANTVELLGGLKEGDQVILSDLSQWDAENRLRLR